MAAFTQSLSVLRGRIDRGQALTKRDNLLLIDQIISSIKDQGNYDASVNTFPTVGSGPLQAVAKGDFYTISVAGTLGGAPVAVNQTLRALTDTPGQTAASWSIGGNVGSASAQTVTGLTQWTEVSITAAQIKAIRATPITLVAAPGAGKILEFVGAILLLDYGGSNVFTEATNNLAIRYTGASGTIVSQTIETTGFIDQTGDTATSAQPKIDIISAKAACENQLLCLHNTSGAAIAGNAANDNVVRVKIAYRVWSTGF